MASVFPQLRTQEYVGSAPAVSRLAKRMSMHSSAAILVFAGMQLWGVVAMADLPGAWVLPFVALGTLLLLAIPYAKRQERRWRRLAETTLPSNALVATFRRDRSRLWRLALIVPTLWIGCFAVVAEAAPLL